MAKTMIYEGPSSQWTNVSGFVVSGLLGLLGLLFALAASAEPDMQGMRLMGWGMVTVASLAALRMWYNTRFLLYRITTDCVEVERGLIGKDIEHVDLFRLRDVKVKIGVFERLAGIGSLVLYSTDETAPRLRIRGIKEPRRVYEALKTAIPEAHRQHRVVHMDGQVT